MLVFDKKLIDLHNHLSNGIVCRLSEHLSSKISGSKLTPQSLRQSRSLRYGHS